ncbi:MAG TPA: uracil-DNA glycosylase [Polyangia bacterium]|nr:uracil-DNA glycosylase [Polyangia bacterium]
MAGEAGDDVEELRALVGQLRTNLEARGRSGLVGVVVTKGPKRVAAAPAAAPVAAPAAAPVAAPAATVEHVDEHGEVAEAKAKTGKVGLQVVRDDLGDCKRCKLAPSRTNLVYGVGNPDAELVFVGEAPGADEDAQGEPFVGKAGQLLTKMIEAMGYTRDDVYICNVLKCRPPGNRNPEPDEVASCEPFLKRQLAAIRPRMIVALGKFAAQCLLRDDTPITRLRGGFRSYEGIPLMPTLHPAYLLRDPSKKKLAWEDLKAVNAALARVGIHPPKPPAG